MNHTCFRCEEGGYFCCKHCRSARIFEDDSFDLCGYEHLDPCRQEEDCMGTLTVKDVHSQLEWNK